MHGYLLIDKPAGDSSFSCVQQVRRTLGIGGRRGTRAGHAGTLDPFATGLLVVLIGSTTRLMPHVVGHDKRYLLTVLLGASSDSDDCTGRITTHDIDVLPDEQQVRAVLDQLAARGEQVPPQVSALHVDGERAYRRVRAGEQLDLPARPATFHSIDMFDLRPAEQGGLLLELDVHCSTGTYMRSLARDLGQLLGIGGLAQQLRRTAVGQLRVADATPPAAVVDRQLRPALELVDHLQRVELDADQARTFAYGQRVAMPAGLTLLPDAPVAVVADGELAGIGSFEQVDRATVLRAQTMLLPQPGAREVAR